MLDGPLQINSFFIVMRLDSLNWKNPMAYGTRVLFVDDNLAVLRAARSAGIGQVIGIHRPQARTPVGHSGEFAAVEQIEALLLSD